MKSIMCIVVITVISEMCFSQEKATPEDFIQNHQLIRKNSSPAMTVGQQDPPSHNEITNVNEYRLYQD